MADLVRGKLTNAPDRPLAQLRRSLVAGLVGNEQSLRDQVVLPIAQRPQGHDPLDDLAGPRIGDAAAGAPSSRRSMDPVDHVVADVERADAFRQHLHLEGVAVARRGEGLIPPARAFDERRSDRLGRAGIDVVDDRLNRIADRRRWLLLLQPVPGDELLRHRLAERSREVVVRDPEKPGARIVGAGRIRRIGQLDDRVMNANAGGLAGRGDAADALEETARPAAASAAAASAARTTGPRLPHERQLRLHFAVLRKSHRHRQVDRAAPGLEAVRAWLQPAGDVVGIAHEEVGEVDQHVAVAGAGDLKRPQHRPRERLVHVLDLRGVLAGAAELVVRLHHQQPRPDAFELDDPRSGQRAAIDADVVRAETGAKAGGVQHLDIELRDFDEQPAAGLIPVHREEPVDLLHAAGAFADRRNRRRRAARRRAAPGPPRDRRRGPDRD